MNKTTKQSRSRLVPVLPINYALAAIRYDIALKMAAEARRLAKLPLAVQAESLTLRGQLRAHRQRVLEACGGNQSLAAVVLGINRRTVGRQLKRTRRTER